MASIKSTLLVAIAICTFVSLYLYSTVERGDELGKLGRMRGSFQLAAREYMKKIGQVEELRQGLEKLEQRAHENDDLLRRLAEKIKKAGDIQAAAEANKENEDENSNARVEGAEPEINHQNGQIPPIQQENDILVGGGSVKPVLPPPLPSEVSKSTKTPLDANQSTREETAFLSKAPSQGAQLNRGGNHQEATNKASLYHMRGMCPADASMLAHSSRLKSGHMGAAAQVQMLDVYQLLPFDNPDGGVWKQGWEVRYDRAPSAARRERRLEVVVVPHSHNDPGWLKTFEGYFADQTRHILDNMLAHLPTAATGGGDGGEGRLPGMRFIYAEMSFFELWWARLAEEQREQVRALLASGVLEIVTGGWVMTDEANAHYYSIVMQLLEGHEFIANQLGYVPSTHWSIDPFGLSPTVAYIMRQANLRDAAIQRVHYSVKKYLAQTRQLEFRWRQLWAGASQATDIRTHMMPFYSYDVPHTCGPNPSVCCQFDFRRLYAIGCPWGKPAVRIDDSNVAQRAFTLADQYRKKGELYAERVLLVPLGDDFRYDTEMEWVEQHANYRRLMEHMNAKPEWNIHARFGTLRDYFYLLGQRLAQPNETNKQTVATGQKGSNVGVKIEERGVEARQLPLLTGDFFTYADRDDHYWSGYFTSRPFYKHLDRTLQHYLRSADILFTLAANSRDVYSENDEKVEKRIVGLYDDLVVARRALSLFQHHDGVTGTAKRLVMHDYGEKMIEAIATCKRVIEEAAHQLTKFPRAKFHAKAGGAVRELKVDERHENGRLPAKELIDLGSTLLLFNSLPYGREEVHCIHVGSWRARVRKFPEKEEDIGSVAQQQVAPVVAYAGGSLHMAGPLGYELCFTAVLPPWGFTRYEVEEATPAEATQHLVRLRQSVEGVIPAGVISRAEGAPPFHMLDAAGVGGNNEEVELSNQLITARFNAHTGLLREVEMLGDSSSREKVGEKKKLAVEMDFVRYKAREHNMSRQGGGDSLSGAYLFLPSGPAQPLTTSKARYLIVDGPIRSSIHVVNLAGDPQKATSSDGETVLQLSQSVWLDANARHISLRNTIDLATPSAGEDGQSRNEPPLDVEIAMRLRIPSLGDEGEGVNKNEEKDGMRLYTDLNGFQMIRRRRFRGKLPLQAHFYPMPGAAFVESPPLAGQQQRRWRVSLLGRQALGVGSYEEGVVDVMLDRRLSTDDDRGLGEGVLDNVRTQSEFRLLAESMMAAVQGENNEENRAAPIGFHSLLAHHTSLQLHYPPITMFGRVEQHSHQADLPGASSLSFNSYRALTTPLPCDINVVALRTLSEPTHYASQSLNSNLPNTNPKRSTKPKRAAALILHRLGVECGLLEAGPTASGTHPSLKGLECDRNAMMGTTPGQLDVAAMFNNGGIGAAIRPKLRVSRVNTNVSLTLLHQGKQGVEEQNSLVANSGLVRMEPMELRTVRVDFA